MTTETTEHVITISADRSGYQRTCTCGYEGMRMPRKDLSERPCPRDQTVNGLCTLQMSWGDPCEVHLVRHARGGGTPGPVLCGVDRFAKDGPGWSVGGGTSGPGITHKPCAGCADVARAEYPGLEVAGLGAKEMADVLGVPWSHWNGGQFDAR